MFVFQYIHMMLSTLFLGDLLKNLGKCVTTLHFSNSSSDCFRTVLNIPSFYHYAIHWFTFHVDGHSLLSSFWIWSFRISPFPLFSFLFFFQYVPSLLIASFLPFLLITLALSVLQRLPKWYQDFLRWRDWTHQHMVTMLSLFSGKCQLI